MAITKKYVEITKGVCGDYSPGACFEMTGTVDYIVIQEWNIVAVILVMVVLTPWSRR